MSDTRKVRYNGKELGPIALKALFRMSTRREIDETAEFWSDEKQQWLPLPGIMFDIEPSRVPAMRAAGIERVSILGSGSDDCPACAALLNKIYQIEAVPELPPIDCSCVPWCRLTVIAAE